MTAISETLAKRSAAMRRVRWCPWATAIATVRTAREQEPTLLHLLTDASNRITDPELRAAVVEACRHVADADGSTDAAESIWLADVRAAFGEPLPRLGAIDRPGGRYA